MKRTYRIRIDGEEMTVTVERQGDELLVERDGERYRVAVLSTDRPIEQSSRGIGAGAASAAATPQPDSKRGGSPEAGGASVPAQEPAFTGTVPGGVPAPVTGTVKEVLVSPGENISQGERVMMMEAMKMDIEIVAPAPGKVAQVFVKAGDNVKENQPLFRIE